AGGAVRDGQVLAGARLEVAGVDRASLLVVARQGLAVAGVVATHVGGRARVLVVTREAGGLIGVPAADQRIARVRRAGVAVAAHHGGPRPADAHLALVARRAGIAVAARRAV